MRISCCLLFCLIAAFFAERKVFAQGFYVEFIKKDKPSQIRIIGDGEEVVCKIRQSNSKKTRIKGELDILNDSTLQIGNQVFQLRQVIYITASTDWWDRKLSALLMTAGGIGAMTYGVANIGMNRPVPASSGVSGIAHTLAITTGVMLATAGVIQFALPGKYFFYNKYWHAQIKPLHFAN